MKLARAFGAAVVLVTHGLSDFRAVGDERSEAARLAAALVADTASSALLAHGDAAIADTVGHLGLSGPEAELLGRLGRGIALWHVGEHVAHVIAEHFPGGHAGQGSGLLAEAAGGGEDRLGVVGAGDARMRGR